MRFRQTQLAKLADEDFDVLIIGGGINGAVCAASLSARGAKVALIDKQDFAGCTSSNSSNLVWGGIKYLESHDYLLVNKLCKSRNLLMRAYPSTIKEIRFLTSIQKGFRFPPFFVYLGTLLYWLLGRGFTRFPEFLTAKKIKQRAKHINAQNVCGGCEYSDAYLFDNDARFVFGFIKKAWHFGAAQANYVEAFGASREREEGSWNIKVRDTIDGREFEIKSRCVINAAGPFADKLNEMLKIETRFHHVFSKGVHLIVDKIGDNDKVLTFFASDGRMFFVIPMGRKTCIGTTDTKETSEKPCVSDEDRKFILDNVNRVLDLSNPLTEADIISERCGVRPLAVEGEVNGTGWVQLSRKHEIDFSKENMCLSIFGGKLTDCINVSEEVEHRVEECGISLNSLSSPWYGEPGESVKKQFLTLADEINLDAYTWGEASEPLSERFWRRYGEDAIELLNKIKNDPKEVDLLIENAEYTRSEIEYARDNEMITKLSDFLRRRSKMSMVLTSKALKESRGLREASEIFFEQQWENKIDEYFQEEKSGDE